MSSAGDRVHHPVFDRVRFSFLCCIIVLVVFVLCTVYQILTISLDCPFLIFYNVYLFSTKHYTEAKDRRTRTPLKTGCELGCYWRVTSSCSTSVTRHLNICFSYLFNTVVVLYSALQFVTIDVKDIRKLISTFAEAHSMLSSTITLFSMTEPSLFSFSCTKLMSNIWMILL